MHQLLAFHFHLFHKFKIYFIIIIFSRVNDKLSRFYQYVYTSTVINYLAPPIILSFSGARACVELCLYTEARSWLRVGLDVSFNECFKRHTRCYAKINTFPTDSSTHKASGVLLQCSEQFKEAKIFLRSSKYTFPLHFRKSAHDLSTLNTLKD